MGGRSGPVWPRDQRIIIGVQVFNLKRPDLFSSRFPVREIEVYDSDEQDGKQQGDNKKFGARVCKE